MFPHSARSLQGRKSTEARISQGLSYAALERGGIRRAYDNPSHSCTNCRGRSRRSQTATKLDDISYVSSVYHLVSIPITVFQIVRTHLGHPRGGSSVSSKRSSNHQLSQKGRRFRQRLYQNLR